MKKKSYRNYSMIFYLITICLCVCTIAVGIYAAKTTTTSLRGNLAFFVNNANIDYLISVTDYSDVGTSASRRTRYYISGSGYTNTNPGYTTMTTTTHFALNNNGTLNFNRYKSDGNKIIINIVLQNKSSTYGVNVKNTSRSEPYGYTTSVEYKTQTTNSYCSMALYEPKFISSHNVNGDEDLIYIRITVTIDPFFSPYMNSENGSDMVFFDITSGNREKTALYEKLNYEEINTADFGLGLGTVPAIKMGSLGTNDLYWVPIARYKYSSYSTNSATLNNWYPYTSVPQYLQVGYTYIFISLCAFDCQVAFYRSPTNGSLTNNRYNASSSVTAFLNNDFQEYIGISSDNNIGIINRSYFDGVLNTTTSFTSGSWGPDTVSFSSKFWLLSRGEVSKFFGGDGTSTAPVANKIKTFALYLNKYDSEREEFLDWQFPNYNTYVNTGKSCNWWTRSPTNNRGGVATVSHDGNLRSYDSNSFNAVRPAFILTI